MRIFRHVAPVLLLGAILAGTDAQAEPTGGKVVYGDADIVHSSPKQSDIIQRTDKAIIDWNTFSIAADELVRFQQPTSQSIALNRVKSQDASYILGQLTANGRVMLINPNGILFGKDARVDVGGLVATTIDIDNKDFIAGRFNFNNSTNSSGTIINRGGITAAQSGIVALVAPGVENSGVISARLGRVTLASGNMFTLDFYGDSLIKIGVDDRVAENLFAPDGTQLKSLVSNSGSILADGGMVVLMAASAAKDTVDYAINMDGLVQARSVTKRNGQIVLEGLGEGIVRVAGDLDASGRGSGESGGSVKVLGSKVGLVGQAKVDVSGDQGGGEALIGGNFQGKGPERNAVLTVIGGKTSILADTLTVGAGGRVIVWSDKETRFFGSVSARGGKNSGDGGFAEISGRKYLQFVPTSIDLGASNGLNGKLLLDPRDVTIADSAPTSNLISNTAPHLSFSTGTATTDYSIQPSAFEAINADITIQATRDIMVNSAIDRSGAANSTLALQAGRNLIISANITGTNGKHSFIFEADSPQSGTGNHDGTGKLQIKNVQITSNGGNITLIGATFQINTTSSTSINAGAGNIYVAPSRTTAVMTVGAHTNSLSPAEIARFSTTGTVYIGTATTGPTGTAGGSGTAIKAASISVNRAVTIPGSGSVIFDSNGTTTLKANVTTASGNVTFEDAVSLTGAVTVATGTSGGNITFKSTVNGAFALTLNAGTGAVDLQGAVGGTTKLTGLEITSGNVTLGAVSLGGTLMLTSTGTITLKGNINIDDNAVSFGRPVVLGGNVTIDTDGDTDGTAGSITFTSTATINGAYSLSLDAGTSAVNLQGAVGGSTPLASLTVTGGQIDLAAVAASGAIAITGTNIDLNGATYNSNDGNITFTGPVDLTMNVSVDSDANNSGAAGNITFTSTVNSSGDARTLTLDANTGAVNLQNAVGGTTKLASLTVTGGQIDLNTVATTGAIAVTGSNIDLNAATYNSDDSDITFTGAVDLHTNVTVKSDADGDTTDGDITFTSTVDSSDTTARSLTLNAGTGAVDLQGAVGGTHKLNNLSITSANVTLAAVTLGGTLTLTSTGTITLKGNITVDDTAVSFNRPVVLGANVTIDTDGDTDGTDGSITFTSTATVNGGYALTLDAHTDAVNLQGAVGGTTKLASLTVDGSQIDLVAVATTGAIDIEGTNIDLNGATYNSDDGNITFTGPVDLTVNVSVDSDANHSGAVGNITFTSTVNSSGDTRTLTLDANTGAVNLQNAVGGTTKLASLTVTGGQIDLNTVATTGAIAITGTNIDLNAATYNSDDGNITFTGPVDLHTNVTVNSDADTDTTDGDITFTSTVNSDSSTPRTLILNAGTGAVDLQGAVGSTNKLNNLSITSANVTLAAVTLGGTLTLTSTGTITLKGNITVDDTAVSFNRPVVLGANVTIDTDGNTDGTDGSITFSSTATVDGGYALTLDAHTDAVNLQGVVGGTTKLASLTVDGGQIDLVAVATSGAIAITGTNIDLNGTTYNSDDGNITFTGPVDLHANVSVDSDANNDGTDGSITFSSTVNSSVSARTLTLDASTGAVNLQGAVGGTTKLTSLTVNGGAVSLRNVRTTGVIAITGTGITLNGNYFSDDGNITFTGPVTLAGIVRVNSDNDDDNNDGSITFTSTVNREFELTLDSGSGAVNLQGEIGGTTALASLTVDGGQIDLDAVATTGRITVEGSNIDLNGATYRTQSANITFTGPVDLHTNVQVNSKDNTGLSGDITFTSTINGAHSLTLDAAGSVVKGQVNLQAAVGGTTKLTSLTVSGSNIDLDTVATTGAIAITGINIDLNGATYNSDDGNITFTGPVDLTVNVSVDSDKDNDTTDGDITFTSTVDGAFTLTLDASTGAVNLQGAVGGTTALTSLTITGGTVSLKSVSTTGAFTVTGTGITLNGNYYSDDNNIKFTGAVTLAGAVSVDSDKDDDTTDGSITFTSTINSDSTARTLTLDASTGAVNLQGAVGGTAKLASLTVFGGQIDLAAVATSGAIAITGTNIDLNGTTYNSDDGNITFTGPVDLHANVSVDSDKDDDTTDGSITFTSTINSDSTARTLTLDASTGAVNLQGALGGTNKLSSLTVVGGQIDLAAVATSGAIAITGTNIDLNGATYNSDDGNITFTGPVDLATNVEVDSDADGDTTDGSITFTSTVNDDGNSFLGWNLTLDAGTGAVNLQGAVGGTAKLTGLTVTGGQIDLNTVSVIISISIEGTNIDLNGATYESEGSSITFTGPVDLHTNVEVDSDSTDSDSGGNITFTSTVDGAYSLTLDAGSADIGGTIELRGAVGSTNKLTSLMAAGRQIDLAAVATSGDIAITGHNIDLNGATYNSDDGDITFTGAVDLHTNVTVNSDADTDTTDGDITFTSTIDSDSTARSLTLNAHTGAVDLQGAVGGTNKLNNLSITSANVTLAAVTLGGTLTLTSSGTITLKGNITVDDTAVSFNRPVVLGANVTIDTDGDNDGTDGSITFTSTATINGGYALTLDADTGAVNLQGAVGGTTKLASLTVDGGQIDLSTVATTGAIDIEGTNIDLNGATYNSDNGNITFTGAVDLHTNVSMDSDANNSGANGNITFSSTINSDSTARTLTLDADGGAVNLQGAVGGTAKLLSLTVNGGQIDLNTVATRGVIAITGTNIDLNGATYNSDGGNITFTGAVDLTVNVSVDSDKDGDTTDGDITFTSTVNGAYSLTLDADTGAVNLQNELGGTTRLASLTVDGGQIDLPSVFTTGVIDIEGTNIDLNWANYNSQGGNITFTGPVDLHTSTVQVTSGAGGGNIVFTSTVDAATAGSQSLSVNAGSGSVDFQGAIGGTTKLGSLTVQGGQIDLDTVATTQGIQVSGTNIDLNGATYSSDGSDIIFFGPVDLHTNVTVDSDANNDNTDGDITFTSTINSDSTARELTLDASTGDVDLQGAVGGTAKLASLTVNGAAVSLKSVRTTGVIAITGTGITLNGNYFSDDGNITFTGPVTLAGAVSVNSDNDNDNTDGTITFTSTVNGGYALTLDADGGAVNLQAAVGGTTKLASLTVDGGQIDLNTVATTGAIDIEGSNIDLNAATYNSDDGNITFTGAVDLETNVTVDSDADNDSTDGSITFTSTVNSSGSPRTLTLDADGGAVDLQGAVGGGTTKLTSLTVNGGQIDLNTVATSGAIAITGTNIDLNGATYNSDDGNITFTGPVDLHANVTVDSDADNDSTDGSITFTSTINSDSTARTLTLDASTGAVNLQGAVGGSMKLTSLTVNGGAVSLRSVRTTGAIAITGTGITLNGNYFSDDGNITFTGPVTLAGAVSVNSDADTDTTDGTITFTSTVNGAYSLTLDAGGGAVNLQAAVGGTTKLASLTVDGGQIDLNTVATTGAIDIEGSNIDLNAATYNSDDGNVAFRGPVDLHTNVTVDSDADNDTTDGSITFTSTVNSSGSPRTLTLDADGGAVDLQGAVGGGTTKLTSLTVNGGQIDLNTVATSGAIAITGTNIDLNGATYNSDDGNITFTGAVDLHANVTVDSDADNDTTDGTITFTSTVNGAYALTLDADGGAVNLQGAVGGSMKLTSLTVNGGAVSLRSVRTTGAIAITGTGITLNGNYFSDDGNITFTGPVTLAGTVSVNSDADTDTTDGTITFTSTVNGAYSLTLDAGGGAVNLQAAVGGTTKLASLTVDGGQIDLNTVATTGAIDITGSNIDLNAATYNSDDGNVAFRGPVDLHTNVTVDSDADDDSTDGTITFTSTINSSGSARTLTLDAGTGAVNLQGAVGGITRLASLTVNGGSVSLRSVRTTGAIAVTGTGIALNGDYLSDDGNITFTGPVTLAGAVSVNSDNDDDTTDGTITFTSTVDGTYAFTVDADGGTVNLQGALGGTTKLASFTVNAGSVSMKSVSLTGALMLTAASFTLDGNYSSDDGNISFTGSVSLAGAVNVDSNADNDGTSGSVTFTSTVDGPHALTVDAGSGSVELQAALGGTQKLASVTVDGGQVDINNVATTGNIDIEGTNIDLNGAAYNSDDGNVAFRGAVDLHTNVSVNSDANDDGTDGNITFTSTLDGSQNLTLNTDTGNINFNGDVGSGTQLATLTITKANNVTVATSMRVDTYRQVTGTGTTDFGLNTLYAATLVEVSTVNIRGRIITQQATLTAVEDIVATVEADNLTVEAENVDLSGKVGGVSGQAAADQTIIKNRGTGSYKFNDFTILGTGKGTRTYSELSSLPLPDIWKIQPEPVTPAAGVYTSFIPMLRTSVNESISGPYAVDVYQLPFSLLIMPKPDPGNYYENFPHLFEIFPEETVEKEQEANAKIL